MRIIPFLLLFLFLHGCMSKPSTCINERTQETIIRWGDGEISSGAYSGHEMRAKNLGVYTIKRSSGNEQFQANHMDSVNIDLFCKRLQDIISTFTAIQSLYSPGKTFRSIEYINPKTNVHKKAIWNPEFATFGSKEFRALHDSLMRMIPATIDRKE
jgi:hypothetical protein